MKLTENEVLEIISFFEKSHFGAMQLEVGGVLLDLRKSRLSEATKTTHSFEYGAAAQDASVGSSQVQLSTLNAPALGVLRLAPISDGPTLVEVGSEITKGDIVALIDVLGTMSPVVAEKSGRISALLCEEYSLVEYHQELFELETVDQ